MTTRHLTGWAAQRQGGVSIGEALPVFFFCLSYEMFDARFIPVFLPENRIKKIG